MEFYLDSANIDEIEATKRLGLLDGVTTNPSLLAKEGNSPDEQIANIANIIDDRPISLEVISTNANDMIEEGYELIKKAENVVIKIPITTEGLKAIQTLFKDQYNTNATLCFNSAQYILACKAGATYVSPFIGRLDDIGLKGIDLVKDIIKIYENYIWNTEVIVASIRSIEHVIESARLGADIATIPFSIINKLIKHPLTDIGLENFMKDYESIKNLK